MQKKFILSSFVAAAALLVFVAASLAVFAFGVDPAAAQPDKTITAVEVAPVQVEPVVIESQVKYEGYYQAGGGCSHSARMQMTYNKSDKETIETPNDQLLTQVQP